MFLGFSTHAAPWTLIILLVWSRFVSFHEATMTLASRVLSLGPLVNASDIVDHPCMDKLKDTFAIQFKSFYRDISSLLYIKIIT